MPQSDFSVSPKFNYRTGPLKVYWSKAQPESQRRSHTQDQGLILSSSSMKS